MKIGQIANLCDGVVGETGLLQIVRRQKVEQSCDLVVRHVQVEEKRQLAEHGELLETIVRQVKRLQLVVLDERTDVV